MRCEYLYFDEKQQMQSTRSSFLHALILLEKTGLGAYMSQIIDDFDGTQDLDRDMQRCIDGLIFVRDRSRSPHGRNR